MKTLLIGLLVLGLTFTGHAQKKDKTKKVQTKVIKLDNITITPLNLSYLKNVQDKNTPALAKILENRAARYNVTEAPLFDGRFEAYEVIFNNVLGENAKGKIIATYDSNGKIITSIEKYTDIALPMPILKNIKKQFPNWVIKKDAYRVTYYRNKEVKKVFKIQIKNGNNKKNLRYDSEGITLASN